MRPLELAVLQFAPALGAMRENLDRIGAAARELGADLLLTPELSLTGYDVGDEAAELALPVRRGRPLSLPGRGDAGEALPNVVVVGLVERGRDAVPRNTMVALRDGRVVFVHRKIYLPTYGMFDEGRFFGRGGRLRTLALPGGWRAGLLVCEDFWHPALSYLLAVAGAHVLLVQSAAPGRSVWKGGSGRFASTASWLRIARTTAELLGVYVLLANRVGVEGGLTFAGGSVVVGPDGSVLARAGEGEEVLRVALRREEIARARRPYAHARDDDPHFTLRELERILGRRA